MKRGKNERKDGISMLVDYYLTRRNYIRSQNTTKSVKSNSKSCSVKEMIDCLMADNEKNNNCVDIVENESHSLAFEETFRNFVNFLTSLDQEFRNESNKLLFTVFTHYCIEMVESGAQLAAKKLFVKYNQMFIENGFQKSLIDSLGSSIGTQSVDNRLKLLRKTKCAINITEIYLQHLIHFLENLHHFTLHRVINNSIEFTIVSANNIEARSVPSNIISKLPDVKPSVNDVSAKLKIEEVTKKVSEQPPRVSCVCLCSFENSNPSCVSVQSDLHYLSAGFENSEIHIWSLTANAVEKSEDDLSSISISIPRSENKLKCRDKLKVVDNKHKCVLRGHSETVYQTCFVPETDLMLSCSEDTTLRAWNMSKMSTTQTYLGHDYPIWCVDASNFGFYFASGSKDTTARLWSVDRCYPLRIYAGHTMDVDCVKFHPNCNYLATGSSDKTIRLWSVSDAKMMRIFQGHSGNVHTLEFTPDGKILVSAGEDRKIRFWDIGSGALIQEFRAHNDTIYNVAINSEQSLLSSCSIDRFLKLWDLNRILKTATETKQENDLNSEVKLDNNCDIISMEPLTAYPTKCSLLMSRFMPHNLLFVCGAK